MSVFRHVFLRWCDICYFFPRCCGVDSPPISPSLLYLKPLRNSNTFLHVIYKSKKKANLLCILTTSFNIARFQHENEMRRKALKQKKIWNPALFGIRNPLSWNPESSTRNPESTGWNPESRTVMDSLTWDDLGIENFKPRHSTRFWEKKSLYLVYRALSTFKKIFSSTVPTTIHLHTNNH